MEGLYVCQNGPVFRYRDIKKEWGGAVKKAKVAFFDFTDCEGCQLQIVNLNTALVEFAGFY